MWKILIIEQIKQDQFYHEEILKKYALIDVVQNIREAKEAYSSTRRDDPYDLVLFNIEENHDEIVFVDWVRSEEKRNGIAAEDHLPIILISALDIDYIKSLGKGYDDFLIKPFSPDALLNKIILKIGSPG